MNDCIRIENNLHHGKGTIQLNYLLKETKNILKNLIDVEVEVGASIGKHSHEECREILYIVDGEAQMIVEGQKVKLGPTKVIEIGVNQEHSLQNVGKISLRIISAMILADS